MSMDSKQAIPSEFWSIQDMLRYFSVQTCPATLTDHKNLDGPDPRPHKPGWHAFDLIVLPCDTEQHHGNIFNEVFSSSAQTNCTQTCNAILESKVRGSLREPCAQTAQSHCRLPMLSLHARAGQKRSVRPQIGSYYLRSQIPLTIAVVPQDV